MSARADRISGRGGPRGIPGGQRREASSSRGPLVCVLDPDGPVREGLRALLRTLGLTVRTFDTAAALLAAAESGTIACVVMELDLPDAEGLQVLRRLRERRPPVPVILMASHGDVPTAVAAMKAGAADFVEKPFVDALLVERVHRLALAGGAEQGPEGGREP